MTLSPQPQPSRAAGRRPNTRAFARNIALRVNLLRLSANEPARFASMLKRAFRGRPWPLTLPSILVGNFSDCAQRQKPKAKSQKIMVLTLKLKAHLSCRVKREGKENGQDARFRRHEQGCE
ncbi:hypothetical protein ACSMDF_20580 [Yersinia enterocolitica]